MGKLQDLKEEAEEEEKDIAGKTCKTWHYLFFVYSVLDSLQMCANGFQRPN